jgi:hypothetical protein
VTRTATVSTDARTIEVSALLTLAGAFSAIVAVVWAGGPQIAFVALLVTLVGTATILIIVRRLAPPAAAPAPSVPGSNGNGALLDNDPWFGLVEDAVDVIDELDRHRGEWDSSRRMLADHVLARLTEVLQRANVEVIASDRAFDRRRHVSAERNGNVRPGTPIAEIVSPGFAVERRILRRARVRVARGAR